MYNCYEILCIINNTWHYTKNIVYIFLLAFQKDIDSNKRNILKRKLEF